MAALQRQVRTREMEFEMRQAWQLKERKGKRRQQFLQLLKELWREEQETAIAELAEECCVALNCIGEGHTAAILAMRNQEAKNGERVRQVEVNQQQEVSRYNIALEKERLRKKLELKPQTIAKRRKRVKDTTAQWDRSVGRFASQNANFKLLSRPFSTGMPRCSDWLAVHKENLSILQPSDYKHTFLHSHLFVKGNEAIVSFKYSQIDAWKAAEVQRQIMNSHKVLQNKIQYIMSKRKVLRGQLAGSKLVIEQKTQLLERENHAIGSSEKGKRTISHHENVAELSKGVSQGVIDVKAHDGDAFSAKIEQGLELTSDGLLKQMSTLVENEQDSQKISGEKNRMSDNKTFLSGCNRNTGCRSSNKHVSLEKESESRVSFKSPCRSNNKQN